MRWARAIKKATSAGCSVSSEARCNSGKARSAKPLPNWSAAAAIALEREIFGRVGIYDPILPLAEVYREMVEELEPPKDHDKHHLLGYPEPIIQDDPVFVFSEIWDGKEVNQQIAAEWMLLLQISSDDVPGMLWGDTSSLYYCIRKDDLMARQFDNAICVEQNC